MTPINITRFITASENEIGQHFVHPKVRRRIVNRQKMSDIRLVRVLESLIQFHVRKYMV